MKYVIVIDASQGVAKGADSFAACVAHVEERDGQRIAVQDYLFEAIPPFSPRSVVAEIALLAHRYHCTKVQGDAHAKGFIAELLHGHGLTFVPLERDRSALYLDALSMLNSGQVVLLDHPKQRRQILALRRALHSGGRISVEHGRGAHDDVANVGLAALVVAFGVAGKKGPKRQVRFSVGAGDGVGKVKDSRTPEQKEFSQRRQERLERLLSGQDVGFSSIHGGAGMTAETWGAIGGDAGDGRPVRRAGSDGSGGGRDGGSSGSGGGSGSGSFPRGSDTSGPFNRR